MNLVRLKIKRQDSDVAAPYWEYFEVAADPFMTVVSALRALRKRPVNMEGRAVAPVLWDCQCLEKKCGSCTMVVNKRVRLACTTLLEGLTQPVTLEPLSKFPVIRDLVVDRKKDIDNQKRLHLWPAVDGFDAGYGALQLYKKNNLADAVVRCIDCGACLEACPQYHLSADFVGAKILAQVYRLHVCVNGRAEDGLRFNQLNNPGGVHDCDNIQNCVRVCPLDIPMADAIAQIKRQVLWHTVKGFFMEDQ
ncbi:MAG: succinate dehydrogenase iron-sulfur subunit [Deltaproteobacteria bacterium]|nr:succinate dehydrogenase iron-sulfur subunit [Deltaproteobacteria bacterium]